MTATDYVPTDRESTREIVLDADRVKILELKREADDFVWLMSQREGRRVIKRLIDKSRVFQSTFHEDGRVHAFREGFRRYGTEIAELVNVRCPRLVASMMEEAAQ